MIQHGVVYQETVCHDIQYQLGGIFPAIVDSVYIPEATVESLMMTYSHQHLPAFRPHVSIARLRQAGINENCVSTLTK